jgi:FKBP-type peptidyl-prolyl cis-trans isomerase FkpA
MKKFVFALSAAALLVGSATSCGSKNSALSAEDQALSDSLTTAWGYVAGGQAAQMLQNAPSDVKVDKEAFLRGVQTALLADTADQSFIQGLSMGVRLAQQRAYAMKELGMDVDASKWMAEFKKALMADSLPDMDTMNMQFQRCAERAEQNATERRNAEKENSPESKANIKAGEDYIAAQMKADPAIKKSASGLYYKIENVGEGDTIGDNTPLLVNYTGRFTDGKEFDSSKGNPVHFRARGVVPGFGEGLKMLKKGGKATLYIPGKLAYGVNGQPAAGIGPNQMLVFDIEVVDVNPDEKK